MHDIFMALLIGAPIAFIIGKIVLAISGEDDGQPWDHDAMRDHWK